MNLLLVRLICRALRRAARRMRTRLASSGGGTRRSRSARRRNCRGWVWTPAKHTGEVGVGKRKDRGDGRVVLMGRSRSARLRSRRCWVWTPAKYAGVVQGGKSG